MPPVQDTRWFLGETPIIGRTVNARPAPAETPATGLSTPGTGSMSALTTPSRPSAYSHETWVRYKGKEILVRDYSGAQPEEAKRKVEASMRSTQMLLTTGAKDLLILSDMTDAYGDRETVGTLKKIGKMLRPRTKRMAAVGVTAIQHVMLQAVRAFSGVDIHSFKTREEALDWLVED